jgi:hypothetical protein
MRVIDLWIVCHLDIQARQMQPYRYMIEITLMVVAMPCLDNHLSSHYVGR